jgi:hypothetical protein
MQVSVEAAPRRSRSFREGEHGRRAFLLPLVCPVSLAPLSSREGARFKARFRTVSASFFFFKIDGTSVLRVRGAMPSTDKEMQCLCGFIIGQIQVMPINAAQLYGALSTAPPLI